MNKVSAIKKLKEHGCFPVVFQTPKGKTNLEDENYWYHTEKEVFVGLNLDVPKKQQRIVFWDRSLQLIKELDGEKDCSLENLEKALNDFGKKGVDNAKS